MKSTRLSPGQRANQDDNYDVSERDAIRILARWNRQLRRDLRQAAYRIKQLELRLAVQQGAHLDDVYSYWLDTQTPDTIVDLAAELVEVA